MPHSWQASSFYPPQNSDLLAISTMERLRKLVGLIFGCVVLTQITEKAKRPGYAKSEKGKERKTIRGEVGETSLNTSRRTVSM